MCVHTKLVINLLSFCITNDRYLPGNMSILVCNLGKYSEWKTRLSTKLEIYPPMAFNLGTVPSLGKTIYGKQVTFVDLFFCREMSEFLEVMILDIN